MVWRASGAVFRRDNMRLPIWRLLVRLGLRARKWRKKAQNRILAVGDLETIVRPPQVAAEV